MRAVSLASIACCALLAAACRPQTSTTPVEPADIAAEIATQNAALAAAFGSGDAERIAAFYAPDGQLLPPNSEPVVGRAAIADYWRGALGAGIAEVRLASIEAVAVGNFAWETGRYELLAAENQPLDSGKYMVLWKKDPAGWQLYRDIWNTSRPIRRPAAD